MGSLNIILVIVSTPIVLLRCLYLLLLWGYRMLRWVLYRQRKVPAYLHTHNVQVCLLPKPLASRRYEWTCGFDVESLLPRKIDIDSFSIEVIDPPEIKGLSGSIPCNSGKVFTIDSTPLGINPHSGNSGRTSIPTTRFPVDISQSALAWLSSHRGSSIFIRVAISGYRQNKLRLYDTVDCITVV